MQLLIYRLIVLYVIQRSTEYLRKSIIVSVQEQLILHQLLYIQRI